MKLTDLSIKLTFDEIEYYAATKKGWVRQKGQHVIITDKYTKDQLHYVYSILPAGKEYMLVVFCAESGRVICSTAASSYEETMAGMEWDVMELVQIHLKSRSGTLLDLIKQHTQDFANLILRHGTTHSSKKIRKKGNEEI